MLVDDEMYERSVAFDTSGGEGLKVTVGVELSRTEEATLLNKLCKIHGEQYRPFGTKSRDLNLDDVPMERLIRGCPGQICVALHDGRPDRIQPIEAVHSAILFDCLGDSDSPPVVVADGNDKRAKMFDRARRAIDAGSSPVVSCCRAEYYYPHAYLADVLASAIRKFHDFSEMFPRDGFDAVEITTSGTEDGSWNRGYREVTRGDETGSVASYDRRRADAPAERVGCWFRGEFGAGDGDEPATDSTRPTINWLRENGYEAAADRLS